MHYVGLYYTMIWCTFVRLYYIWGMGRYIKWLCTCVRLSYRWGINSTLQVNYNNVSPKQQTLNSILFYRNIFPFNLHVGFYIINWFLKVTAHYRNTKCNIFIYIMQWHNCISDYEYMCCTSQLQNGLEIFPIYLVFKHFGILTWKSAKCKFFTSRSRSGKIMQNPLLSN